MKQVENNARAVITLKKTFAAKVIRLGEHEKGGEDAELKLR